MKPRTAVAEGTEAGQGPDADDAAPDVPRVAMVRAPAVLPPVRPPAPPPAERPLFVLSSAIRILALITMTFVATLSLIGPARHARDQQTAFSDLRGRLANATAPVTQTDEQGQLYPLGTPVAVLDVPQIDLREVVLEGTTSTVLMSGPGHRRDTPLPGQMGTSVIIGRQAAYGGPFRSLHQLKPGQVVSVTTGQGRHVYRVVAVRRAGDFQPPALQAGKGRLTLITAAGRPWVPEGLLRVDADLVSTPQASGARPLTPASLPPAEKAMRADPSRWIWIVLLAQALLLGALGTAWARQRWGRWQVWVAGGPFLLAVTVGLANQVAALLPNVM